MSARALRKRPAIRLAGILSSLALAAILLPCGRVAAQGAVPGLDDVLVEPAAPIDVPPSRIGAIDMPAPPEVSPADTTEPRGPEPVRAAVEVPPLPQVTVEVPVAEVEAAPAPVPPPAQIAVPAPAEQPAAPRLAAEASLASLIQARLADPALPLPPRFLPRDREALTAAYGTGTPLWIRDGGFGPAAEAVIARLGKAQEDGLDPADYPVPRLESAAPADLAEADIQLSAAAYLYARDARGGRLEPKRLGGLITPNLDLPGVERVLATLAASADPGAALHGFNPRYPGYVALREKLAEIRAQRPPASARLSRGGTLVASTGSVGGLQGGRWSPRLEGDLIANMERWRWLPAHVADRYLVVNIPEYRVRLVDRGRVVHETRVIVGASQTPTPVFSDTMDHAVVNPSWFVPPSILKKMNPEAAARQGYQVTQRRGVTSIRMPPGPRNALGYIKLMFPNDHAVYLHDTPNRGLFGGASRALSHGCVRVQNPFELGGKILGPHWTEARLKALIGSGERTIRFDERLPIHLSYFTHQVDEFGDLRTFGDIYGHNARVRRALGLGA